VGVVSLEREGRPEGLMPVVLGLQKKHEGVKPVVVGQSGR